MYLKFSVAWDSTMINKSTIRSPAVQHPFDRHFARGGRTAQTRSSALPTSARLMRPVRSDSSNADRTGAARWRAECRLLIIVEIPKRLRISGHIDAFACLAKPRW